MPAVDNGRNKKFHDNKIQLLPNKVFLSCDYLFAAAMSVTICLVCQIKVDAYGKKGKESGLDGQMISAKQLDNIVNELSFLSYINKKSLYVRGFSLQ